MQNGKSFLSLSTVILGASMLSIIGCGDNAKKNKTQNPLMENQQTIRENSDEGTYRANLNALNAKVAGHTDGHAELKIMNGRLSVEIHVEGSPAEIVHVQHIHTADKCPTMKADVNNDGYLDVVEGVPAYGPILVSLDGDLSSESAGAAGFPVADRTGSYFYSESVSYEALREYLMKPDPNPNDAVVKLEGDRLNLAGRHIVIHGVPESTNLPDSVASLGDIPSHVTLPIACGEIVKVNDQEQSNGKGE